MIARSREYGTTNYCSVNTLLALELVARTPLTIPQLAEQMQQLARTTRRLVYRLEYEGYLVKTGTGWRDPYTLGPRARDLGAALVLAR